MAHHTILLYLPALIGGGAERVFALLASAFVRAGHEVHFAVDHEAQENLVFLDSRVQLHVLPRGHLFATLGLARLLMRLKPDVTLSGIGVSNLKHMIAATMTGRRKRAIISFHAFFATENSGLLTRIGNTLTPLFTRMAGHAVAVSDGLKRYVIDVERAYAPRVRRIYNPVILAPESAVPDAAALAARPPVVLYLGRFHPDKDVGTLLRAFAEVKHPGARLILAGDGVERASYEAQAEALGIRARCDFLGYVKNPGEVLGQAKVLACSSIRESFGNVVAEALGYGLAVVSTAAEGPAEILGQGKFGAVVPIGDDEALAKAMDAALAEPGDPALRVAHAQQFSVEHAASEYLTLFDEVIAKAR
ncbi:MAG: glycosyltransferase [Proteobacteria bacterium]|nr:glycosyltransferase [Pseudomonadota bacterium]